MFSECLIIVISFHYKPLLRKWLWCGQAIYSAYISIYPLVLFSIHKISNKNQMGKFGIIHESSGGNRLNKNIDKGHLNIESLCSPCCLIWCCFGEGLIMSCLFPPSIFRNETSIYWNPLDNGLSHLLTSTTCWQHGLWFWMALGAKWF